MEAAYTRIHTALMKESKELGELAPDDSDVLAMILLECKAKDEIGAFGYFAKPRHCAAIMGLFLTDGTFEDKLRGLGMPASAHEWPYLACARYWTQVARVASAMFRDDRARIVAGLDAVQTKCVIGAWRDVFVELSDKVLDIRVTFMRMAVDSGVAPAKAGIKKEELAAQISGYGSGAMAEAREEYAKAFLFAEMKEAAKAQAVKKSRNEGAGGAASAAP